MTHISYLILTTYIDLVLYLTINWTRLICLAQFVFIRYQLNSNQPIHLRLSFFRTFGVKNSTLSFLNIYLKSGGKNGKIPFIQFTRRTKNVNNLPKIFTNLSIEWYMDPLMFLIVKRKLLNSSSLIFKWMTSVIIIN